MNVAIEFEEKVRMKLVTSITDIYLANGADQVYWCLYIPQNDPEMIIDNSDLDIPLEFVKNNIFILDATPDAHGGIFELENNLVSVNTAFRGKRRTIFFSVLRIMEVVAHRKGKPVCIMPFYPHIKGLADSPVETTTPKARPTLTLVK